MTQLMGILNITPDSFSDGGKFIDPAAAAQHFAALVGQGAQLIDIGAESTRPGATPLSANEEWARLEPVLAAVMPCHHRISIDTRHAETARQSLIAGAHIINDVTGLTDARMRAVLAAAACPIIVMHSLSVPVNPLDAWPADIDPIAEIMRWKAAVTALAAASGIAPARLIYDPGLGFGKSAAQSLALIARAAKLVESGGQWLFGHSRKSFLKMPGDTPQQRDAATLEHSKHLVAAGVQFLRVHNVALHREALCM